MQKTHKINICYRSRLSLDLSSPTSEFPAMHPATTTNTTTTTIATTTSSSATAATILSPRYSEFKTYNSTFDGLHALENSNNILLKNCSGSGNDITASSTNNINNNLCNNNINNNNNNILPLMRVASLPSMSPAHSGNFILFLIYLHPIKILY